MNTRASVETIPSLTPAELAQVTGGGLIAQITGLFGEKGARFGSMAESLFAKVRGLFGAGQPDPASQQGQPQA